MARGVNKFIGIGHLCADPETRYMPSGNAVSNIRIAINESWKDKQTGEKKERAEFINIAMFGRLAEIAAEYLRKGSQVYIEGKLQTDKWQDRDGNDRYTTKIIANQMQMLGSPRNSPAPVSGSTPPAQPDPDDFDDDIPF